MKKFALWLTIFLFGFTPLPAIDFEGVFQVDYYGLIDPSTFYHSERMRITLASELQSKSKSETLDFHLSVLCYFQPIGESSFIEPERIIREAYLGFHMGIFDINLGQKFVHWGKVDFLSPLNVINHSDSTVLSVDNILEASLPDPLVQVQMYPLENLCFDFVYVPFIQPNIYDIEDVMINESFLLGSNQYDINASFVNREVPLFSEWAHSLHVAGKYTS